MLRLAGKLADICFIGEENPEKLLAAKNKVERAAKEQNRVDAPSFACAVGIKTLKQKDDLHSKIEKILDLGISYVVTGIETEHDYLEFLRSLDKDIIPSFK